jgi:thiamine pyrophosphate-dependent acetolactate synthase large subunit-like protein
VSGHDDDGGPLVGAVRSLEVHLRVRPRRRRREAGGRRRSRRRIAARQPRSSDLPYDKRYRRAAEEWWEAQLAPVTGWSGAGGNTSLWANSCLPPTRPRSYHSILELGMLGTGIPSAIGARLGAPDRDVVKITTIVFAEGSWTMEEPNERMLYGRTFGTEQGTVRWDRVAEGLGCHGEYVERIEDVESALQRARDAKGPMTASLSTQTLGNLLHVQAGLHGSSSSKVLIAIYSSAMIKPTSP